MNDPLTTTAVLALIRAGLPLLVDLIRGERDAITLADVRRARERAADVHDRIQDTD